MTLIVVWSTVYVFCRTSPKWDLSDVLLMIRLGLCVFRRKTIEVNSHAHHILSRGAAVNARFITTDVDLDHLAEEVSVRFLCCEVTPVPSFHTILFGRKSLCTARGWGMGVTLHLLVFLYNFFWNFSAWELCLFSPICVFSQGLIYASMDSRIFIRCSSYHPMLLCLFCCSNCSNVGHRKLFQLSPLSVWHTPVIVCGYNASSLSGTSRCSRFILYMSCSRPRIGHFCKETSAHMLFYWRIVLGAKTWMLGMLDATGVSPFLVPVS